MPFAPACWLEAGNRFPQVERFGFFLFPVALAYFFMRQGPVLYGGRFFPVRHWRATPFAGRGIPFKGLSGFFLRFDPDRTPLFSSVSFCSVAGRSVRGRLFPAGSGRIAGQNVVRFMAVSGVVFLQIQGVDRRIFRKKEGGKTKKRVVRLFRLRFRSILTC